MPRHAHRLLTAAAVVVLMFGPGCRPKPPAPAPPAPPQPPQSPQSATPPPVRVESPAEAFRERLRLRRAEGSRRVEQARRDLAAEKEARERDRAEFRTRLSAHRFDATLRNGRVYASASIVDSTLTDVELETQGGAVTLPWDVLAPAAILIAADLLYDTSSASSQFERGRFLLARRLWKEAREAFDRALKLDETLKPRIWPIREPLENVINGRGAFGGRAQRRGPDGLLLMYDFGTKEQLNDFTEGLGYTLGQTNAALIQNRAVFHTIEFVGEVAVDMKVRADDLFYVDLFSGEKGAFEVVLSSDGAAVHLLQTQPLTRREIARTPRVALREKAVSDVRISVQSRRLRLQVDRDEPWTVDLPAGPDRGLVGFRIAGEALIRPPLTISGTAARQALDKRFAEAEILARRAADPDLRDVEELRRRDASEQLLGGVEGKRLSADDPYLLGRLAKDPQRYDAIKKDLLEALARGEHTMETLERLNGISRDYPDAAALWYLRALFWFGEQDMVSASDNLAMALRLFPDFAEAHTLEGVIRDWNNDCDGALAAAAKALAALPDYAPTYALRAIAGYGGDPARLAEWIEDARLTLKLQPANREAPTLLRALRYQVRGPRDLGCRFESQPPHYRVMTDISDQAARTYGERLEGAFAHFAAVFKDVYTERPIRKPRVVIFNTAESFHTYLELLSEVRDELMVGVYSRRWNELVIFEDADPQRTLDTLYHEAFHHFTTLMTRHTPPFWYNEGMAEYMAGISVRDGKVVETGRLHAGRLLDLRSGVPLSFEIIMCQTPGEFYSGNRALKYAQAWSMLHFFHRFEKGRYRPLIGRYFAELRAGRTARESFDAVFADRCAVLEREWAAYVKSLK